MSRVDSWLPDSQLFFSLPVKNRLHWSFPGQTSYKTTSQICNINHFQFLYRCRSHCCLFSEDTFIKQQPSHQNTRSPLTEILKYFNLHDCLWVPCKEWLNTLTCPQTYTITRIISGLSCNDPEKMVPNWKNVPAVGAQLSAYGAIWAWREIRRKSTWLLMALLRLRDPF